jgi:hypothetical protein
MAQMDSTGSPARRMDSVESIRGIVLQTVTRFATAL